jgi:hypothetical protein
MELVFEDTLFVHYGFVFLSPADEQDPDLDKSRRGQVNGLLGAGTGDALALTTGTHTGDVPLRVEWYETQPELDDDWDDVVEATVDITGRRMRLAAFDDHREVKLPATGPHRARLCAAGFEAARLEKELEDDRTADRYLLQLWPAAHAEDAIVRVSGPAAQYWHDEARNITSMSEQDWAARQEASVPSDAGGHAPWAPSVGPGLSDERLMADVPMSLRVELREPIARRACEAAGIANREPIRAALEALRDWQPLPSTMTSPNEVLARLRTDDAQPGAAPGGAALGADRVPLAVRAVFAAADPSTAMNMLPLLDLAKGATGLSGEDLVRKVCAERDA